MWESFERTYAGADSENIWEALFEAGRLMRKVGVELADGLGYKYPMEDDKKVNDSLSGKLPMVG